ncbi:MAG: peptide chain release factor N(5)-glutamine methyltransferase [Candidatus Omnitrophica bacterium]|nr:peptide chain release factor N(5)-glutamine methyltransferase [Candidatus Omnitrophota bacterium]
MNETEQMLTVILNCRRDELHLNKLFLTQSQQQTFDTMKKRRKAGEPLQYILGNCDFMGTLLKVDPRVLIPRPETEILVEKIQTQWRARKEEPLHILDLGTGSGNIAIVLAKYFINASVTALDKSADALALAEENARDHKLTERIRFICGDMQNFLNRQMNPDEKFDMIVSNPPYIRTKDMNTLPDDVKQEPVMALDGGADGLEFYRMIISQAGDFLNPNGMIYFEIGDGQFPAVQRMFQDTNNFDNVAVIKDYRETDRIVVAGSSS